MLNNITVAALESSCKQTSNAATLNEHVAVFPEVSVAVQVTVVMPNGKQEPDAGLQATVTPGQLSLAVGAGKVALTQLTPGLTATAVTLPGHVITGACVSFTVTVNVQLGLAVVEQVTVVVPNGNVEPERGAQLTVNPGCEETE